MTLFHKENTTYKINTRRSTSSRHRTLMMKSHYVNYPTFKKDSSHHKKKSLKYIKRTYVVYKIHKKKLCL